MDLSSLISYWPLNESADASTFVTRVDAYGGNHMTGGSAVASGTGLVYALAADVENDLNHNFYAPSTGATFHISNASFTLVGWVKLESKVETAGLFGCGYGSSSEYYVQYYVTGDRFRVFYAESDSGTSHVQAADALGAPALATWYCVIAWYDKTAQTLNIQVNDGTVNTTSSLATGPYAGTQNFQIGSWEADGLIGPVLLWSRVLTAAERTALYNGGAGLTLAQMQTSSISASHTRPFPFRPGSSRTRR